MYIYVYIYYIYIYIIYIYIVNVKDCCKNVLKKEGDGNSRNILKICFFFD